MTALPETVTPETTIKDAARIMADQAIGDVIVVEPGTERVVGIVTDRDIADPCARERHGTVHEGR